MKKNTKKKPEGLWVKKKISDKDVLIAIYDLLEHFKPILPLLNGLLKKYRLYYPGNSKECIILAMKCLLKIYIVCGATLLILCGLTPSFYALLLSCFFSYVFSTEIIKSSHVKLEIRFLKAFDAFLGNMRHHYYGCGSVRDALAVSEMDSSPIIKGHVREMLSILSSSDPQTLVNEYVNSGYHKYLKFFLTLLRLIDENGDQDDENGSVFVNSCMRIRYEVQGDLRSISERRHRFSGLTLTNSLPAAAIPFIAMWGTSTIPSLSQFYYGYVGVVIKILLLLISIICYNALLRLKYGDNLGKKNKFSTLGLQKIHLMDVLSEKWIRFSGKKAFYYDGLIRRLGEGYNLKSFFVKRLLMFFVFFAIAMVALVIGHQESKKIYRYDITDIENLTSVTDLRQLEALERLIPKYMGEFCERGYALPEEKLIELILEDKDIRNENVAVKTAQEILKRFKGYMDERFGMWDVLMCFLLAFLGSAYPCLSLSYRKSLIEGRLQDEVMQFQSIIHILKRIPGISVVSLLYEMERFSSIYKPALKKCINDYSISDSEALNRLYEEEKYPGFRRIIDCFMMADELGIDDAFEEISAEIENYSENRKMERKILLDNEGMLGTVISVLPGGIILFGYLLCPFLIRSIQIFNEYQAGISMLAR